MSHSRDDSVGRDASSGTVRASEAHPSDIRGVGVAAPAGIGVLAGAAARLSRGLDVPRLELEPAVVPSGGTVLGAHGDPATASDGAASAYSALDSDGDGATLPLRERVKRAVYADLASLHALRSQIDALEAVHLETVRFLEVADELEHRLEPLGPDATLGGEDLREANEIARLEVGAEWAAITNASPRTGAGRVERARQLVNDFSAVHGALGAAQLTPKIAEVLCEIGARITDPEIRARYEHEVLAFATQDGATPPRVRPRARRVAERLCAETREERHARAAKDRKVYVEDRPDGMSELVAVIPSVQAAGIYDRLTQVAKRLAGPDEPRRFDELRADVFSALLLTSPVPDVATAAHHADRASSSPAPTGIGAPETRARGDISAVGDTSAIGDASAIAPNQVVGTVMITIPVLSLLGVDDEPATLDVSRVRISGRDV